MKDSAFHAVLIIASLALPEITPIIGTFIIINLFISVIVRKSEEAYKQVQRESEIPLTQHEIVQEIKEIRRILEELEKRIGEDDESKVK
jgi:hypothetical protein